MEYGAGGSVDADPAELSPGAIPLCACAVPPEAALASLRRIQHHTVSIKDNAPVSGISTVTHDQAQLFSALKVKQPAESPQLSLL